MKKKKYEMIGISNLVRNWISSNEKDKGNKNIELRYEELRNILINIYKYIYIYVYYIYMYKYIYTWCIFNIRNHAWNINDSIYRVICESRSILSIIKIKKKGREKVYYTYIYMYKKRKRVFYNGSYLDNIR